MSRVADQHARRVVYGLSYVFLIGVGISMLAPLLWMVVTSLKAPEADVYGLASFLPSKPELSNYRKAMVEINFARALFNSFLVTISVTVGQVFTSSLAAYAFARMEFRGRDKLFLGYLATMMIPAAVTTIPLFILMRHLRWINTYWALLVPGMFSAYGTFMLRQFFMTIPKELEDAAIIDGCGPLGVYWNVILPLSKPALATLGILTFMGSWRSFMWPLIVTHTRDMFTLPVALAQFQEMHGVQWTLMMAGSVIMIIPMLVIFIFGQRYFVEGIQLGAIKG
jgi:multiple sugar transport system permease protein